MRWSPNNLFRAVSKASLDDVGTGLITLLLAPVVEVGLRLTGLTRTAEFSRRAGTP